MTVVVNGSDPHIYLTNGTRQALSLTGQSTQPESVVQKAQEEYFNRTGEWPYVYGMPNVASKPPAQIGEVVISGDGITEEGGLSMPVGAEVALSVETGGDASDVVYEWDVRTGDCVEFSGEVNQKAALLTAVAAGMGTVRCSCSADASDSPQSGLISVVVTEVIKAATTKSTKSKK